MLQGRRQSRPVHADLQMRLGVLMSAELPLKYALPPTATTAKADQGCCGID